MGWRALASGLALTATLLLPMAIVRPASALDRVVILSTYRSSVSASMLPRMMGHAGVDFGEQMGAPVLAAAPGTVSRVINWPPGCGNGVVIEQWDSGETRRGSLDRLVLTFPVPCLFWLRGQ